jgi:hypothetical protein
MKRVSSILAIVSMFVVGACDRTISGPESGPSRGIDVHATALPNSDFYIPETLNWTWHSVGPTSAISDVSFHDWSGNRYHFRYRYELYDGTFRLVTLETWFNEDYLGSDHPVWDAQWNPAQYHHDDPGFWSQALPDGTLRDWGIHEECWGDPDRCQRVPVVPGHSPLRKAAVETDGMPDLACDPDTVDPQMDCWGEFRSYARASASLLGTGILLGGAIIAGEAPNMPPPAARWMVTGSAILFADALANYHEMLTDLRDCIRASQGGRGPRGR